MSDHPDVIQAWLNAAGRAYEVESQRMAAAVELACEQVRPSILLRPALAIDGNKWCALYGANLQDGVAGFGDSPAEAFADFDREWTKKLPAQVSP